jgi:hypothetical protein
MSQNNHLAGPCVVQVEEPEGMTEFRKAVWWSIRTGASRRRPMRFGGSELRAAKWLHEDGHCERTGRGFYVE